MYLYMYHCIVCVYNSLFFLYPFNPLPQNFQLASYGVFLRHSKGPFLHMGTLPELYPA